MKNIISFLFLLPLLFSSCVTEDDGREWVLPAGSRLPRFSVVMNDGRTVTQDDFLGRTGIIVFFSTGCPDCRRELPLLQQAYEDSLAAGSDALFVCIAREETSASIQQYWEEEDLTLPYSPQPDRRVYNLFATIGIPRIFVTSPDGKVRLSLTEMPLHSGGI